MSFSRIEDILNNSAYHTQLDNHIDEYVRCQQRIADEKESQKGIVDAIKEKINIDPKIFRALANVAFKGNAVEKQNEVESLGNAISMVFNGSETEPE
jgi:hypothetical protein